MALGQQFSKRLVNQDVIDMVAIGLSDEVIIDKIHATGTDFDTSVAGLKALKAGRVSNAVIRVMINPTGSTGLLSTTIETNSPAGSAAPPTLEAGVYVIRAGKQTEVEPEVVNWQTGGVAKSTMTLAIVKGDLNGKVAKAQSPLQVVTPIEFLIKTVEGTFVTEYQLLHLHQKGDRREFRSVTGGVLHQSGGAVRDELPFESEKIGPSLWRVRIRHLPMGEYGFLSPGILSVSISSSGKIYTFGVTGEEPPQQGYWDKQKDENNSTAEGPPSAVFNATIGAGADGNASVRHDGVTLSRVTHNGPADQAGIKAGDVILAIDNHYLFTIQEFNDEVHHHEPGTKVSVRYRRYATIYDTYLVVGTAD